MSASESNKQSALETQKVFDHHLGAFAQGLDELMLDYDKSSVVITPDRTYTGDIEIRGFLRNFIDGADPKFWDAFSVINSTITGKVAYLLWEAKPWVTLATDTFLVHASKISVQTFTPFAEKG